MVSEYSLEELLESIVELNMFSYVNSDQTSDSIDAIITEFERSFGDHPNVTVVVEAAKNHS